MAVLVTPHGVAESSGQAQSQQRSALPPGVHDIDALCNLLGCPDYIVPIFQHLRNAEVIRDTAASSQMFLQIDQHA